MDLFDPIIQEVLQDIAALPARTWRYGQEGAWADVGHNELVLQREAAYELDGIGFDLVTSAPLAPGPGDVPPDTDRVTVVGEDLAQIKKDRPFARISLLQIEDVEDEQLAHDLIKKIDYQRYHYFPTGYMARTSTNGNKETVRVSQKALKGGITFGKVGDLLRDKFREIPEVRQIHTIYVTDLSADYRALGALADKATQITKALDHIINDLPFNCAACDMKPLCDEVDGLREMHKRAGR